MDETVRGYKVFNKDWTCAPKVGITKQYTCPGKFEESGDIDVCGHGMHFCENAADCFNYYKFNSENKVAEVIAYGKIKKNGDKSCTDKVEIVREIPWQELLTIVNTGKDCTGYCNTGNSNTGDRNTGNRNTGDRNTGDRNTGNRNTGDWNTGNCNTGNRNTGNRNTGDWNTGDCNTGNCNTGCFNTSESKINLFNRPSDITYREWLNSDARYLLNRIPKKVVEWISENDMTDKEKEENPTYKTTGGYLKVLDESESAQIWWDGLSESDKSTIKAIPNFDSKIFEECTGIKIREVDE